jgi:hypothetical protein
MISLQVGIAAQTLYLMKAVRTISQAGYPHYEIWQKSDTYNFLRWSTWFVGIATWFSSLWVMVTLAGLLLRTDLMLALATTFAPFVPGIDGSAAWQVVTFLVLATSLMTHGLSMGSVRGRALVPENKAHSLQNT